jgi:hypothetical protein
MLFPFAFTAFKIGFHANFAKRKRSEQKTIPVQNNNPKSGNTKSISFNLNFKKFCRYQPQQQNSF